MEIRTETFKKVSEEANVNLHEVSREHSFLGFEANMTDHTFKFAQKWLEKVKQRRNEVVTLKDLAILLGCLLWGLYAMDMPLAFFPEIMQAAMETGSLASTKGWNIEAQTMNTEFWEETGKAIEAMESPFSVKQADFDADDALNIFSDAACDTQKATWAFCSGQHSTSGLFEDRLPIFLNEFRAAAEALVFAAKRAKSCTLWTDNTGVMFALRSRHSTNRIANGGLQNSSKHFRVLSNSVSDMCRRGGTQLARNAWLL